MKILQIHNVQLAKGGADNVIERERQLLLERGHEVEQFFVHTQDALKSRWQAAIKAIWNREACRNLRKAIADNRPDIAHVHTPFPILSPAIFRQLHGMGLPTIETLHSHRMVCIAAILQREGKPCQACVGHRFPTPAIRHRCYHGSLAGSTVMASSMGLHHLLGTFASHVDRYIALSPFGRDKLLQNGFPADRIVVKPNFVVPDAPPGNGEEGHVVYVGRMVPEKGVLTLVNAWRLLKSPPKLLMIGDGPLKSELQQKAEGLPIEFLGWQTSDAIFRWLRSAALVVFPSEIYEAGPLVILESYASGTPVLASDVGNFSDQILPGSTGDLFRVGDPASLASKVASLLSDDQALQRMRTAAFNEYLSKYSADANYQMLMDIYHQAIQMHATGRV